MPERGESALEFPCEFPVKVMGQAHPEFVLRITEVVREHVPDLRNSDISTASSRRGNYVSVTVTITATSQEQLDSLYRALNARDDVVMTL